MINRWWFRFLFVFCLTLLISSITIFYPRAISGVDIDRLVITQTPSAEKPFIQINGQLIYKGKLFPNRITSKVVGDRMIIRLSSIYPLWAYMRYSEQEWVSLYHLKSFIYTKDVPREVNEIYLDGYGPLWVRDFNKSKLKVLEYDELSHPALSLGPSGKVFFAGTKKKAWLYKNAAITVADDEMIIMVYFRPDSEKVAPECLAEGLNIYFATEFHPQVKKVVFGKKGKIIWP